MSNFNSYWPIFKNLENETLQLAKYVHFSDDQQKVYSMYIADLIMRIVVEIESLSKELYKQNGGPALYDDNGKQRNLYFDTDCIKYLDDLWGICDREVMVSCANFYYQREENRIIKPLKKASRNGDKSSKWNRAYQAVKHDRRNNLEKGNIESLILALGALYILNIYYRSDASFGSNENFDNRLGSDIFAASYIDATKTKIGQDATDAAIDEVEMEKRDSALCIVKYTAKSWEFLYKESQKYNNSILAKIFESTEFKNRLNERVTKQGEEFEKAVVSLANEMQVDLIKANPPIQLGRYIVSGEKEVVLNKGQAIYNLSTAEVGN